MFWCLSHFVYPEPAGKRPDLSVPWVCLSPLQAVIGQSHQHQGGRAPLPSLLHHSAALIAPRFADESEIAKLAVWISHSICSPRNLALWNPQPSLLSIPLKRGGGVGIAACHCS